MQRERNINVKENSDIAGAVALADRPAIAAGVRLNAPRAFQAQEPFWAEVRKRIVERRPNAAAATDRLY